MSVIVYSPEDSRHRLETELSQPELAAIGYVTVLWAELEHHLLRATMALAGNDAVPEDAVSLSFKKRLRAWRALIKSKIADKGLRGELLSVATLIGGIERSRNRITHGLWEWQFASPAALRASSFRVPFDFDEPFDFRKLIKIGNRIGETSFRLRFPNGWEQAQRTIVEERLRRGAVVSRRFALEMSGRDPANPHRPQPTLKNARHLNRHRPSDRSGLTFHFRRSQNPLDRARNDRRVVAFAIALYITHCLSKHQVAANVPEMNEPRCPRRPRRCDLT